MGFKDTASFSNAFRRYFRIRPKKMMNQIKVEMAEKIILKYPSVTFYEVALSVGKKDEKELYKLFVNTRGIAPSGVKKEKEKG
jgi:methylphosphotriester-DNA--protein-cysteine methyltransferase